ncbi:type II secretion system F family protein [Burkholderiaceae bacterium DAT-1]|nr:type II secretion system F family protein [Burkholderiaceae bacterium DAT-1]
MGSYQFRARDGLGNLVEGMLDAPSETGVVEQLRLRGLIPVDIVDATPTDSTTQITANWRRQRVTPEDIMLFSRQMHTLLKAGVPILSALAGLRESCPNPAFALVLGRLRDSLDSGRELSIALTEGGVFSPFFIAMVRVGEMTGHLDTIFLRLYEHLEFDKQMRQRVRAALRYPSFVLVAMVLAMIVINVFVVPAFAQVFAQYKAVLPLVTRMLIAVSNLTVKHGWLIAILVLSAGWGIRHYLRTDQGRYWWDETKLKLPIVGGTLQKAAMARFTRSFALALKSGIPVTQGLMVVGQVVDNRWIAEKLRLMRLGIERGDSVLRVFSASTIFPPLVLQMIQVGEETGDMDGLLDEVAGMYEREVAYDIETLSVRIEPVLIVILAGMVMILALGVFLPMWDLGSTMLHRQ